MGGGETLLLICLCSFGKKMEFRGCVTVAHSPRVPLIYLLSSCPPDISPPPRVRFLILFLSPFSSSSFLPIKNDTGDGIKSWKVWVFWYILKFLLLTPRLKIYFSETLLPQNKPRAFCSILINY